MNHLMMATPESLGIKSTALLKLMQRLGSLEYINSIILQRHGKVCLEAYVKPYEAAVPHQLFSLSKSFTSCAIGFARAEGLLDLHDKLIDYFPEYKDCVVDPRMLDATLQDLLTMRSGHMNCPSPRLWGKTRWAKIYLSTELDCQPGTAFAYNSAATYMLAAVIKKVTGLNAREYLMPRLFEPLNIAPGIWESSPEGINCGGWGLYLTTCDIAKFAQLILQNGIWQGKQLLPADYLAEAIQKHADNSSNTLPDWQMGYGYQFWRSQHGFRGDGAAGQFAIMLPEEDISIAITSCLCGMQSVLTAIWEDLLPDLSDSPLPEAAEDCEKLRNFCSNMKLPCTPGDITRRGSNAKFEFIDNPEKIKSCEVTFGDNECALTFDGPNGTEQLRAGFGFFISSIFQLTDNAPHPTIASAAWQSDNTLEIRTFITDGIFRDVWRIDFNDAVEPLKNSVICACFGPQRPRLQLKK